MKRIIICCDGTWNWPDQKGSYTNVVKMVRAILPSDLKGIPQVVFYDTGVGTGNFVDRVAGGMFGIGLAHNVKRAYGHIADNYETGDELFLFGFSRGAFTVRSLGGLIGLVGILRKETMDHFQRLHNSAWDYYRTPPEKRTPQQAAEFLAQFGAYPPYRVNIHCIGVWDTVGALGIPRGPLRFVGRRVYSFHNTNLGDNVGNAFQALAIDDSGRSLLLRSGGVPHRWNSCRHAVSKSRSSNKPGSPVCIQTSVADTRTPACRISHFSGWPTTRRRAGSPSMRNTSEGNKRAPCIDS